MAKSTMHTKTALAAYVARAKAAVEAAELRSGGAFLVPNFGAGNSKTGREITEATLPVITCSALAACSCAFECYAIWHMANLYAACMAKYAHNTVARRIDCRRYYRILFAIAELEGATIRLNEAGDFESVEQLEACAAAARKYPTVKALGYTRRPELMSRLQSLPGNMRVLYSVYRDGDESGDAIRAAGAITVVSESETTCPAQIAAARGEKWTCAACAASGVGCWSRSVVVFKAH